jgi:hypothetical protein
VIGPKYMKQMMLKVTNGIKVCRVVIFFIIFRFSIRYKCESKTTAI